MKITAILTLLSCSLAFAKTPVWIDYDVALGKVIRDVDDGFALFHALESEELDIVGISTVFGNIKSPFKMVEITQKILKKYERTEIPVYRGAESANDLGNDTPAVSGLIKALEKQKMVVLAMGRLTNVASVVKLRPDLVPQISELLVMGGRQMEHNTPVGKKGIVFWDANIDGDFQSVREIIKSKTKLRMIPTESMSRSIVNRSHLKKLRKSSYKPHRWLGNLSRVWKFIWAVYPNMKGFIPWDLFLVSYLTHPEDFECLEDIPSGLVKLKNDTTFNRSGENGEYKYFLTASKNLKSDYLASYCYSIKSGHVNRIIDSWVKKL